MTSKRRSIRSLTLVVSLLTVVIFEALAYAHEGHAALPTKGTLVDLKQGTVFLTREARDALAIATAEVELKSVEKSVLAYATLESPWNKHAFATSRVGGRIDHIFVKPGQAIKAGEPLAEVQSLELENLQLELLTAENELTLSERVVKNLEPLARDGAVAGRELMEAQTKHAENQSASKVARLKLRSLGFSDVQIEQLINQKQGSKSRPLTVTSPISGIVTHADLTVGKVIEPNEHLFEIIDLSSVWVRLGLLEKDINQIAPGQRAELRLSAFPKEKIDFNLDVKNLALDPQTHLGAAWGEVTNSPGTQPKYLPGMYGQARIIVYAPGKRAAVPTSAVVGEGAERFVLVEDEATDKGSQFRKRNVVVDAVTPQQVFLREGNVFPGDRVLTQGAHVLATYFAPGVLRPSEEAKVNIGLRVQAAGQKRVEDTIELDGVVDVPPDARATVAAQLPGTVDRIRIDRGQMVKAGDVVAELASLEFQNLQLEMLQADQQVRLLGQRRKLSEGLSGGVIAQRRLWELDKSYTAAALKLETTRRKLEGLGLNGAQLETVLSKQQLVDTLPLRAPITGAIVHFDKALGQAVTADEPLFEIHDLSHVWVKAFISEAQLPHIRSNSSDPQGARIRLAADPNAVATGKVVRSGQVLGTESHSLEIWIELDRPPTTTWQHNMLARVTLTTGRSNMVLAVPRDALALDGTRAFVFVQRQDGVLERRTVETGRSDDRYVEIVRGLQTGETIAVTGAGDLQSAYAVVR